MEAIRNADPATRRSLLFWVAMMLLGVAIWFVCLAHSSADAVDAHYVEPACAFLIGTVGVKIGGPDQSEMESNRALGQTRRRSKRRSVVTAHGFVCVSQCSGLRFAGATSRGSGRLASVAVARRKTPLLQMS